VFPHPKHQYRLDWKRQKLAYYAAQLDMERWLCPALFTYFQEAQRRYTSKRKCEP
jgi:hypothetical protein